MSSTTPLRQPVTDGLIAMLATATGFPCWDADGPDPADSDYGTMPYSVVEHVGGGIADGDVGSPDGMVAALWQVTSVGATRAQALGLADRVRDAVLSRDTGGAFTNTITATGVDIVERRYSGDAGTRVEADIVNFTEDYRLTLVAT